MTQTEAIINAFNQLGGVRTIREIEDWVKVTYGVRWKDFATQMADMVPLSHGGNGTSLVPNEFRILKRISRGTYCVINETS